MISTRGLRSDTRLTLLSLAGLALPLGIASMAIWRLDWSMYARALCMLTLWITSIVCVSRVRHHYQHNLRNLANLVESIRVGDYSMRLKISADDALGELAHEINRLASSLQEQRFKTEAAHRLVDRIVTGMDMSVLAFDPDGQLTLANPAAAHLMQIQSLSIEHTANSLHVADWIQGRPDQIVDRSFPGGNGTWRVQRDTFMVEGRLHTLLMISDLQSVLHDEEQKAWRRLIRVFSHEVNNSLGPIASVSHTLKGLISRSTLADCQTDAVDGLTLIEDRARHLADFVRRYAELAKFPEPRKVTFDLAAMIDQLAQAFPELVLRQMPPSLTFYGDPAHIEQLLINLLKNAIEAGATEITLSLRASPIQIHLIDNGHGIANPANLFVPFYTTKPEGSGIGLVLCRQIAAAHGGTLHINNRPTGKGAEVAVNFPSTTRS